MLRNAIISFILFIVFDTVWLGLISRNLYLEEFKTIGRISDGKFQIIYWAGALVYILLAFGLSYFVFPRFDAETTITAAFFMGALFGLVSYGVYDMTNYATLKDFSLKVALIDMSWGTFNCAAVTASTYYILSFFK